MFRYGELDDYSIKKIHKDSSCPLFVVCSIASIKFASCCQCFVVVSVLQTRHLFRSEDLTEQDNFEVYQQTERPNHPAEAKQWHGLGRASRRGFDEDAYAKFAGLHR